MYENPLSPIIRMFAERIVADYLAELAAKEKPDNNTRVPAEKTNEPEGRDIQPV